MKKFITVAVLAVTTVHMHAQQFQKQKDSVRSRITSGAGLGGQIPRNLPTKGMAEKLFEKLRPQPHSTPRKVK